MKRQQGEEGRRGGGQKSLKMCGHPLWMAPVDKQTFRKLYGYKTREFLGLRMQNFQGIIFI